MEIRPVRKKNRLAQFDYSSGGAYFITVCTKSRKCILGEFAETTTARPTEMSLSKYGQIVDKAIKYIPIKYPAVSVDSYIVMPNHIHLLLRISADENGRPMVAPTISTVIQQTKSYVTKQIGLSIWQRSFHDHIIRDQKDYDKISRYICENLLRWQDDCYYCNDK